MGEDNKCEMTYNIIVPSLHKHLPQKAQNLVHRKIYDYFRRRLCDIKVKEAKPRLYFSTKSVIEDTIITACGKVVVFKDDDGNLEFGISRDPDIPRSIWRAGQLALYALSAGGEFYFPERLDFMVAEGRLAKDLVAVNVKASQGDKNHEILVGVVPLHYFNERAVRSSLNAIREIEQEAADELNLKHGPGVVTCRTTIAYAWHQNHGVLPAFHEGEIPRGLEAKVIHSGVLGNPAAQQT